MLSGVCSFSCKRYLWVHKGSWAWLACGSPRSGAGCIMCHLCFSPACWASLACLPQVCCCPCPSAVSPGQWHWDAVSSSSEKGMLIWPSMLAGALQVAHRMSLASLLQHTL